MDTAQRFWAKVRVGEPAACWEWMAGRSSGYGRFGLDGSKKYAYAHRYAYELMVGPIPEGLHIDHLCRNRACVNPAHLEPVTLAENNKRAGAAVTACKRGHEYTPASTITFHGARQCRVCVCMRQWHRSPTHRLALDELERLSLVRYGATLRRQ